MIEITIKQTKYWTVKAKKNMVTKRTPTEVVKVTEISPRYSGDVSKKETEPQFVEEFAVQEIDENQSREFTLLKQEIPTSDEAEFSLSRVIKAINNLP